MIKKSYKKLLPTLFSVSLMLIVVATVSVAWFSMNKQVDSNGMKLSVEVTPNLIIAKALEDIGDIKGIRDITQVNTAEAFSIDYSDKSRANMAPATLDWAVGTATGLKYVTNTNEVDFSSGIVKTDKALQFAPVTVASDSKYYIDYDIYIASAGKELVGYTLTANIFCESSINTHKAATVVFYQGEPSAANYIGSIAVANREADSVSFVLVDDIIPLNTDLSKDPIHIIARCFFDGDLTDGDPVSPKAYINSATVDTSNVDLKITFTAVEKPVI